MSRRTAILVALLVALLLWGVVGPLVAIHVRLRMGASVQQSLLIALPERFPNHAFEKGGVGYSGPSAGIWVKDRVDPATQLEIRRFLEAEKANRQFGVEIHLRFMADEKDAGWEPIKI